MRLKRPLIISTIVLSVATVITVPTSIVLLQDSSNNLQLQKIIDEFNNKIADGTIKGKNTILPTDLKENSIQENLENLPKLPSNGKYNFLFTNNDENSNGGNNFNGTINLKVEIKIGNAFYEIEKQSFTGFQTTAKKNFIEIKAEPTSENIITPQAFSDFIDELPPSNIFKLSSTSNISSYRIEANPNDETSAFLLLKGKEPSDNNKILELKILVEGFISINDPQALANIAIEQINNFIVGTIKLKDENLNKFKPKNIINENLKILVDDSFKSLIFPNNKDIKFEIFYKIDSFDEKFIFTKIGINILDENGETKGSKETENSVRITIRTSLISTFINGDIND